MKLFDRRTEIEKKIYPIMVIATDRETFESEGWPEGGKSFAGWACRPEDVDEVMRWAKAQPGMLRVRRVGSNYRPSGEGLCSVCIVGGGHPAVRGTGKTAVASPAIRD